MTAYTKKIHIDKVSKKCIILAAKNTNGPGHQLIELSKDFEKLRVVKIYKKIKLATLEDTGLRARIKKVKKNDKIDYLILKIFNIN